MKQVIVVKEFTFLGISYKIGDRLKIIGNDPIRGWDLEDKDGNKIYETRFIYDKFKELGVYRNSRLNNLLD